ncbi:MAG: rRNA maturation RNase YbeY [Gallionella sp.]
MSDTSRTKTHKVSLAVQYASSHRLVPTRAQFRGWIKAALQRDVQIVLRIVDEAEGRELNRTYRSKDYATNVLTFVYDDCSVQPVSGQSSMLSGDIVICAPVVEKEALEQHKDLLAHYVHLTIHAVLHMQGYEHEREKDAAKMESLETALMLKLRYPDPYQETRH